MNEYLTAIQRRAEPIERFGRREQYGQNGGFSHGLRDQMTDKYAWAIPNDEAIAAIAALGPIVEIGAGRGYWAYLLRKAGADVIAYDTNPGGGGNPWHPTHRRPWFPVKKGNSRSVALHPDRTLFLCWPPYLGRLANDALRLYRGDMLVYVGEGFGGCNADPAFFGRLERDWEGAQTISIPQWWGINDYLTVFRRRRPAASTAPGGAAASEGTSD